MLSDFEMGAGSEGFTVDFIHLGFGVPKVDALHGLLDVKFAMVAVAIGPVPIEDSVGGIRVLLNFVDEKSGSYGVKAAGFDKDGLAFLGCDRMDLIGDCAVLNRFFESVARHSVFETDIEF